MLAKLVRSVPPGDGWSFEPKWDGFRCVAFRDRDAVELQSRNERPLARYFPELVHALSGVACDRFVIDGEIVVVRDGRFDFDALMSRLHPSKSWVDERAATTPATFVAFDALAIGDDDLRAAPFFQRRGTLEQLLTGAPSSLRVTPLTRDRLVAHEWLERFTGSGIDGVVAKADASPYEPGRRTMLKIKRQHTADCVVAGFRWLGQERAVSSLLLGAYDDGGVLRHVGVVTSFPRTRRIELVDELQPLVTSLGDHPWERGFGLEGGRLGRLKGTAGRWVPDMGLDWVPLRPQLVCEVAYDQMEGLRLRHPAGFLRWRPDRDAPSCTTAQFEPATEPVAWPTA